MDLAQASRGPRSFVRSLCIPAAGILGILAVAAMAGSARAGPLRYGVRAGVNLATIRGDFAEFVDPKIEPGLAAGGFATLSVLPMLGLEMDVLYVQKGFKVETLGSDDSGNPVTAKGHLRLQYIDVPVVAKVALPSWGVLSTYLVGGPTVSFGLKAKGEVAGGLEEDLTSDMKKVVFGATGGLGLKLGSGPVSFGLESRYSTDFGDLWDLEGNVESINQGVSITGWVSR
jgi:hypothetical protein